MAIRRTNTSGGRAQPARPAAEDRASLVARLAARLRGAGPERGSRDCRTGDGLTTFARRQIASLEPLSGVDLADPISISADHAGGAVRVELARLDEARRDDEELLARTVAHLGPALFADGRIGQIEVGLVPRWSASPPGVSEQPRVLWAIARSGLDQPCSS